MHSGQLFCLNVLFQEGKLRATHKAVLIYLHVQLLKKISSALTSTCPPSLSTQSIAYPLSEGRHLVF